MARILVLSDDPETCLAALHGLEGQHDVRACNPDRSGRGWPPAGPEADVVVIDAPRWVAQAPSRPLAAPGARPAPAGAAPSIVALVAEGEEHLIVPCFELGAHDYLLRPPGPEELAEKVEAALAQRLGLLGSESARISISDEGFIVRDPAADDADVLPQLGRYEVQGVLGKGGYGVVYRARDLVSGQVAALKVLPREMNDNPEAVTRFFRESSALARLDDPSTVRFHEVGCFRGRYYFTMELVEGRTLKEICEREAPLLPARAARYVAGIARALVALDSVGLVHRDVKPENVIVTADDEVKLIDFGLVRIEDTAAITSQSDVLGTPYFMAPEYIRAPMKPDIRCDLYAVGVTFFHLLTGEYPFDGKNAAHVMEKHLRSPAPRVSAYQPGVPPLAERVVDCLLEKDPARRFQKPQDLLRALGPLLSAPARRRAG